MAAKLARLTHKIAIQLHLVAKNCNICSSRCRQAGRQSRNFWIHPRIFLLWTGIVYSACDPRWAGLLGFDF